MAVLRKCVGEGGRVYARIVIKGDRMFAEDNIHDHFRVGSRDPRQGDCKKETTQFVLSV